MCNFNSFYFFVKSSLAMNSCSSLTVVSEITLVYNGWTVQLQGLLQKAVNYLLMQNSKCFTSTLSHDH